MFSLFNDDNYPKQRRSVVLVSFVIIFVVYNCANLKLPTSILDLPEGRETISAGTSLKYLWAINLYLIVRVILNGGANLLRSRAGITRETDIPAQTEHWRKQLQALEQDISSKSSAINRSLAKFNKLKDEFDRIITSLQSLEPDLLSNLDRYEQLIEDAKAIEQRTRNGDPNYAARERTKLLHQIEYCHEQASEVAKDFPNQIERLASVHIGEEERQFLVKKFDIQHYENKESAQAKAANYEATDQFWLAPAALLLVVVLAIYQTLEYFYALT